MMQEIISSRHSPPGLFCPAVFVFVVGLVHDEISVKPGKLSPHLTFKVRNRFENWWEKTRNVNSSLFTGRVVGGGKCLQMGSSSSSLLVLAAAD